MYSASVSFGYQRVSVVAIYAQTTLILLNMLFNIIILPPKSRHGDVEEASRHTAVQYLSQLRFYCCEQIP